MKKQNYHLQCALFLLEANGLDDAILSAVKFSREAFQKGDMNKHFHWKFVVDYIEALIPDQAQSPQNPFELEPQYSMD